MEKIEEVRDVLYKKMLSGVVEFQYKKQNGEIRNAKGTLDGEMLEEVYTKSEKKHEIRLNKESVDIVIIEHGYKDIHDYADNNDVEFSHIENDEYVFKKKKRKIVDQDKYFTYYDVDKKGIRSFLIENYIGILEE